MSEKRISLGATYRTDDELANGFPATLQCGLPIVVARYNNSRFRKRLEQLRRPHELRARGRDISPEIERATMIQAMSEAIWLSWDGEVDCEGEILTYSPENAKKVMTTYPDLLEEISTLAITADKEAAAREEADRKN